MPAADRPPVDAFLAAARAVADDADRLAARLRRLLPGHAVVNVHAYAWAPYEAFHRRRFALGAPPVAALSMNPGRNGAVQTGLSFTDAPTARELLPDFDRLVDRPAHLVTERVEMSGRKLRAWAESRLGGLDALHRHVAFPLACPVAVLRGPRHLNVPLPALRGTARRAVDAFYERHAPSLVRALDPRGLLLLGRYAAERWSCVAATDPVLARVPAFVTHHPAARIENAPKFAHWSGALARATGVTGNGRFPGS